MSLRRISGLAATVLLVAFLLAATDAAAALVGDWNGASTGDQQNRSHPFTLLFRREQDHLSGTFVSGNTDLPMENLRFSDGLLRFQLAIGGALYNVRGKLSGTTLQGTYSSDQGQSGTWRAEKSRS